MKLPCYLVQDLLPLYKDHVCDEQTSADVAEHLSDCAACSALLAEMDAPPQETAVQEEQAAEAAEALSTVKKNLRARQVKITLAAVGGLLALICAFFGWRYWMMHSYVDLPVEDLVVEETHEVLPSDSYGSIHTIQKCSQECKDRSLLHHSRLSGTLLQGQPHCVPERHTDPVGSPDAHVQ